MNMQLRTFAKWLFVATAFAVITEARLSAAPKTVRLLTVGNSFADNALTYLPQLVEAAGHRLIVGRANLGGCTLERHWRHASAFEADPESTEGSPYGGGKYSLADLLKKDRWDFITIQQVSYQSHDPATFKPYADKLYRYISERVPRAEILMHQIWAYRVDDPRFGPENKGKEPHTQVMMFQQVRETYLSVAARLGIDIIPSGDAMYRADTDLKWGFRPEAGFDPEKIKYPTLPKQKHSLHAGWSWRKQKSGGRELTMDGHHASEAGKYLLGCVWFETFFGESAADLRFAPTGMAADYASFLRHTSHLAVAESR